MKSALRVKSGSRWVFRPATPVRMIHGMNSSTAKMLRQKFSTMTGIVSDSSRTITRMAANPIDPAIQYPSYVDLDDLRRQLEVNVVGAAAVTRAFLPLVRRLARRLRARLPANVELDELVSAGVMGLLDAVDNYDHAREQHFQSYAALRIRGAMLDELRRLDWVPRSVREKARRLATARQACHERLGRAPEQRHRLRAVRGRHL